MKPVILSFPRTIYQLEGENSFLDPWTSLNTKVTYQHLRREILFAIARDGERFILQEPPLTEKNVLRHWLLVLPRRAYTLPKYPHFQLWYLSKYFTPTLALLPKEQLSTLPIIIHALQQAILNWQRDQNLPGQFVFGINATPFAFIKRKDGSYWPGGQSVRAFHLSCLLLPGRELMQKEALAENRLGLVYPSDFALNILKFWFHLPNLHGFILGNKPYRYLFTRRGLVFKFSGTSNGGLKEILALLRRFDQIAYQVELILIRSMYKESEHFLEKLETLLIAADINALEKARRLHLRFTGNSPLLALEKIWAGLQKLDVAYGRRRQLAPRLRRQWKRVTSSLFLNDQKEPASLINNITVVLRPGMGYGYLQEATRKERRVWIMPLDTLSPKGIIEARGFSFSRIITQHQRPVWLEPLKKDIKRLLLPPSAS